jgi:hypothetical protein
MTTHQINIDMDEKCAECNKGGATQNGLCLGCILKSISKKPMRSDIGKRHRLMFSKNSQKLRG